MYKLVRAFAKLLCCAVLFILGSASTASAEEDSAQSLRIAAVRITGNKTTKPFIILRECSFKVGDSISRGELPHLLQRNEQRILNTQLFVTVAASVDSITVSSAYIHIDVKENWYLFPVPFVRLNDRNIPEWQDRGSDFRRLNYGVYLEHQNLLGKRQKGLIYVDLGLNTRVLFRYQNPHVRGSKNDGLFAEIRGLQFRGVAVNTNVNKLDFVTIDSTLLRLLDGKIRWRHRQGYYKVHFVEMGFSTQISADTLRKLNQYYLTQNALRQRYTTIAYAYRHDNRDNVNYPLKGAALIAEVRRVGLLPSDDVKYWQFRIMDAMYLPLGKGWYGNAITKVKWQTNSNLPYNLQRGLGYEEDYLRGYELYVVNGTAYGSARVNIKRKLLERTYNFNKLGIRQLTTLPLSVYACAYTDLGYVYQKYPERLDNNIANTWLYSNGIALEMATFYNVTAKLNFSRNAFNELRWALNLQKDLSGIWN